jgi:hypothetical protein|tara:strand:- start:538 stop:771 length:234 start_codon:yes stop_codon:yes gene_type:complete
MYKLNKAKGNTMKHEYTSLLNGAKAYGKEGAGWRDGAICEDPKTKIPFVQTRRDVSAAQIAVGRQYNKVNKIQVNGK